MLLPRGRQAEGEHEKKRKNSVWFVSNKKENKNKKINKKNDKLTEARNGKVFCKKKEFIKFLSGRSA